LDAARDEPVPYVDMPENAFPDGSRASAFRALWQRCWPIAGQKEAGSARFDEGMPMAISSAVKRHY
jgi:hypothetical protein